MRKWTTILAVFALVAGFASIYSCGGGGGSSDSGCELTCSAPPTGKFCVSGRLRDTGTNEPITDASSIVITFYDGASFATTSDPMSAYSLTVESLTVNGCGWFLAQGVTTPGLGYLVVATDDMEGVDDYVPTAALYPVAPNSMIDGLNLFATRSSTDGQWTTSAGNPFGELSFSEKGAVVPIFMHLGEAVAGVKITVDPGGVVASDDYYFSDTTAGLRTTVDVGQDSTGANGTGVIVNTGLVNHGGVGGGLPVGCDWPESLAKSIAGVLMVQEVKAVCQ